MKTLKCDYNKRLITLTVITINGFHSTYFWKLTRKASLSFVTVHKRQMALGSSNLSFCVSLKKIYSQSFPPIFSQIALPQSSAKPHHRNQQGIKNKVLLESSLFFLQQHIWMSYQKNIFKLSGNYIPIIQREEINKDAVTSN